MSIPITGVAPVPRLRRFNPLSVVAASLVIALGLLASLDLVSAGASLAAVIVALIAFGVPVRFFWTRTWPVWVAAPGVGLTLLLYTAPAGRIYFAWLFVTVSDASILAALAATARVLAMGLPAVIALAAIDLTAFADALGQRMHLPARFVLGALAALRMLSLFVADWRMLELARRARGLRDRGRLRRFASQAFALLVLALRRGTKLAVAMEARGLGSGPRVWARPSRFGARDWLLIAGAVAVAAGSLAAAVLTGAWNPIFSPQ